MINENKRDIKNVTVIGFLQEKFANSKSYMLRSCAMVIMVNTKSRRGKCT